MFSQTPTRSLASIRLFVCRRHFRFSRKMKSQIRKLKTQNRDKRRERKKLKNHNYNRLGEQTRPYYLILISHLFHTTRHRHLVDDFTARLEGPMYQGAPPRTHTADPPHPMHNATSASDGSPPPSSVIRLWSSVFGLLSGRHANWQLPCECANAATLRQPTTQPARHDATRWPLHPYTTLPCPLSHGTAHCPLAVGSSKVWLQ